MRRLARWQLIGAMVVVACPNAEATAQDIRELERRVDAMVALQNEAINARAEHNRRRPVAARVYPDTVAVLNGALRFVTDQEFLPMVRDAATRAEGFIRERAGARSALLRETVFAIRTDSIRRAEDGLIISPRVDGREVGEQYIFASADAIFRVLALHADRMLGTSGRSALSAWIPGLPIDSATGADWRAARFQLVASPSAIARRCHAGEIMACKATLGLVAEADPATAWYDSATRRAVIGEARRAKRVTAGKASACLAGSDSACVVLLRTDHNLGFYLNSPGSAGARSSLLQVAFDMGGPGGLERLAASEDTPAAAVSAIARAPIDSVVARWQHHARDGGVESETATPVVALTAVAWVIIMAGLSLRSSRWR